MDKQADHAIDVTIYTDPLCCWSWAFEPQLHQVKNYLGNRARWEYRMGGLISTWNNFHDEINSISRPAQMGPVWMHAGQVAQMPIYHQLWMTDPPASSYPSCIAVKSAQLQSPALAEPILRLLRVACMTEGKNIAKQQVLFEVASRLANEHPEFDPEQFRKDFENGPAMEAFRADLEQVRNYNINRFPSLIIRSREQKAIIISGYRQYTEVVQAIEALVPGINFNPSCP